MEEEVWIAGGARGALPYEEERVVGGRDHPPPGDTERGANTGADYFLDSSVSSLRIPLPW